jgi:hypothetical protein
MATRKRSVSKARTGTAGKRKTAARTGSNAPKRKKSTSGRHHRASAEHNSPSRKKRNTHRTVRSSSRASTPRSNSKKTEQPSVIDADSDKEIFGVQMSERRRRGESKPAMPEAKTKHTKTLQPKKVPNTGIAKGRKRT